MLVELYDALKNAGADEEHARKAAETVAAYDNRLATIEAKLDRLATKVEVVDARLGMVDTLMNHTRIEMRTLCSIIVGIALGILWRVWH
jgi:phage shock protein A